MIQKFKLEDNQTGKIELGDLYNSTCKLDVQYQCYYKNMANFVRVAKGNYISSKINELITLMSKLYFDKTNYNTHLQAFYYVLRDIEFQWRNMYKCGYVTKKINIIMSKCLADIITMCRHLLEV